MTNMATNRPFVYIRLKEEDRKLLKEIAKKYDISESDVVKVALKKFAKELGVEVSS
nr:CopG family transcriptional regulator [Sulfolobus islandicus]